MKKKTIAILLVLALATGVCATAAATTAATPRDVQAALSPDITVKYNGEVLVMRDANGDEVYPILYNGSTYLPVRAICGLFDLPVNWVGETRTAELGETSAQPRSLLAVTDAGTKTTTGNISQWVKVTNKGELPCQIDETGDISVSHSEAIKTRSVYMLQQTGTVFKLDGEYYTLSFTAYNTSGYAARLQIIDFGTKTVLWSAHLEAGGSMEVSGADISGSAEIEFVAELIDVPVGAGHHYDAIYFCDPKVK